MALSKIQSGLITDDAVGQSAIADGVGVTGPTFRATQSTANTGVASNTYTKVIFDTEVWDTDNCYDHQTNYRFTPNVAGYYLIQANCQITYTSTAARVMPTLYKNGSLWSEGNAGTGMSNQWPSTQMNWLVDLNGSTDYVEIYIYGTPDGSSTYDTAAVNYRTNFSGCLLRKA